MLQLWKLVLLCGLLTGSSASLLGDLGNDLSNVVDIVKSGVQDEVEGTLNTVKNVLDSVQKSKTWGVIEDKVSDVQNFVEATASNLFRDLTINKLSLLSVKLEKTPDGQGINVMVPLDADVSVKLPVVGELVHLRVTTNILSEIRLVKDSQTGLISVIFGQCNNPGDIKISLLNRQSRLINRVLDSVLKVLKTVLTTLLQDIACPVLNSLSNTLTVDAVQNLLPKLEKGAISLNL